MVVDLGYIITFLSAESINEFYNLEPVNEDTYLRLQEAPNYPEVIRMLANGQGEWMTNNEGHEVHFKAKHFAYIPKVWHHFITSRLIPTSNVCEVMAKRSLLNYAIIQDIPFDVGLVIEDVILYNKDAKMNLEHPFLIYGLCKKAKVPLESDEAWIHPIKAIVVKKNKLSVPRLEGMYDSGNEPSDEEELRAYQAMHEGRNEEIGKLEQSSTQPPPPTSHEKEDFIPSESIKDQLHDLTTRFYSF